MGSSRKREQLKEFETICRKRGLAQTVQRRRIFELLLDRKDHPTADDVYEDVKEQLPGVSRTTVYRVLEMLVDTGIITKASSPGSATRFDPNVHRHHHLVCLHCDSLIDLDDASLDETIKIPEDSPHSFQIQGFSIHFYGVCAKCRRQRASKSDTSGHATRKAGVKKRDP